MLSYLITLAVALTAAPALVASEETLSPHFSWKSRLPSRVRAMTAHDAHQSDALKSELKDVELRVAETTDGPALRSLILPTSPRSAQRLSSSVIRLDSGKTDAATPHFITSNVNATADGGPEPAGVNPSNSYWTTILRSGMKNLRDAVDVDEVRKEIPNSVKFVDEFVHIGKNKVSKERIVPIGDIDGNGFMDYVVATPCANNNKGSIRLYLMKEKNGFLFSRELVPGKWGFGGPPLKEGDEFGSKILRLPTESGRRTCALVVGAPGDNATGKRKGAVYILELSKYGSVAKSVKVSADTDKSLALQLDDNEGFGTDLEVTGDLQGDGRIELAVGSALGSTTILFMDSAYNVKTGLKMQKSENGAIAGAIRKTVRALSNKLDVTGMYSSIIRPSVPSKCVFNETYCACGLKTLDKKSDSCLDVVDTSPVTGKSRCAPSDCKLSYVCTCDGAHLCKRVDTVEQVWVPAEDAGNGLVFCVKKNVTSSINEIQTGAVIPVVETTERLSTFNDTHCRCSPKHGLFAPYECLDFLRTEDEIAVLCTSRDCNVGTNEYSCDGMGGSYCERRYVQRTHFVNDGTRRSEPGVVYCHQVSSLAEIVTPVEENAESD